MESTKRVTTVFTLMLDEEEARLLKALVQNRISENETEKEARLREKIFNSLDVGYF